MQSEAGATFLDVCASVEEDVEVETLKWMIDIVQEVSDTPICVDSPSAKSCVAAIPFCKKPGLINSVSLEGDKIDTIFPVIADTDWECVALLCDNDGIPDSVERRMKIFFGIMEKAKQYGIAPGRLHIDPLVVTLGTDQTALTVFADCCRRIKYEYPDIHITSPAGPTMFGYKGTEHEDLVKEFFNFVTTTESLQEILDNSPAYTNLDVNDDNLEQHWLPEEEEFLKTVDKDKMSVSVLQNGTKYTNDYWMQFGQDMIAFCQGEMEANDVLKNMDTNRAEAAKTVGDENWK